ncbi:hypothetical protein FRC07_009267 [Ceratobasidium sp. 392]|nr:hypothetical protein FRC07_009267 [Ceratobasidium sp. 392]
MSTISVSPPNSPAHHKVNDLITPPASEPDVALAETRAKWKVALGDWVETGATSELILHCDPLDSTSLDALAELLEALDIYVKYDWYSISKTVVVTMICEPHDVPFEWLQRAQPQIHQHISEAALCGVPVVQVKPGASIPLGSWGPTPDGAILLKYEDESGEVVPAIGTTPRIVLETANTQSPMRVLAKATRLLHQSNNEIQAVIVCIIHNSMGPKMQVEIDVWTQEPSNDYEQDFELDHCQLRDNQVHKGVQDDAVSVSSSEAQSSEPSRKPTLPRRAWPSPRKHGLFGRGSKSGLRRFPRNRAH